MRKISKNFKEDLLKGSLKSLLKYVKEDDTLDLELRGKEITVYYRGGALLSIEEESDKVYTWKPLDAEYKKGKASMPTAYIKDFANYIPQAKHVIDKYIVCGPKNHLGEKEIQQLVVKENNYSPNSNDTDFFIVDMEYQDRDRRFDLIALRWDSNSASRRSNKVSLAIIEVKQGIKAIRTTISRKGEISPGLKQHQEDFNKFIENPSRKKEFIDDMLIVFKQKCELGLIKGNSKIKNLKEDSELVLVGDLDFACLLANYKTASHNLKNELAEMNDCQFFTSSFMGYGLYSNNIIDKKEMLNIIGQKNN